MPDEDESTDGTVSASVGEARSIVVEGLDRMAAALDPKDLSAEALLEIALPAIDRAAALHRAWARADRPLGQHGAWRFDLLLERSDRVLAVVELLGVEADLEQQVFALSRLGLGVVRGVAEAGFLVGVVAAENGIGPLIVPGSSAGASGGQVPPPLRRLIAGTSYELVLIQAASAVGA